MHKKKSPQTFTLIHDNPHAAYAGKFPVCRFKIYCNEIRHDFATPLNKKIR